MSSGDSSYPTPRPPGEVSERNLPTLTSVQGARADITVSEPPEDDYDPKKFLNEQEVDFCHQYIKDFNGRKAAIRASYSPTSAHVTASTKLNNYNVALYIQRLLAERRQRMDIDGEMIMRELGYLALSNIGNYVIDDDGFVDVHEEAPSEALRAVKSIKRRITFKQDPEDKDGPPLKTIETEITLWEKPAALKQLGMLLGMYIERHEHTGPGGGPIQHVQTWIVNGREIKF